VVLILLALELDLDALGRAIVLDPFFLKPGVASVFHILLLYPGKEAWFQAFTRTLQSQMLAHCSHRDEREGFGRQISLLRLIFIILRLHVLDTNFHAILRNMDILLFHLVYSALSELVAENVHLW
jgi:hypothetical protein